MPASNRRYWNYSLLPLSSKWPRNNKDWDDLRQRAHQSVNLSTGPGSGVTQCLASVDHIAHVSVLDFLVGQPGTLLPASSCGQEGFRDLGAVAIEP